eukprot:CAMPEP_0196589890 /NCGR_PEP_ID=MMETSP1081-20130531/64940_1 /TAXON_ID=36882 /ORGANISM="Pyramimonas amylifera, Strain CCMP720" /LENGTH=204 /DNA_ID=CAMNT_0041912821 /DNA_START=242 /DNA_END=852 /DNA_ORIENTATION=-
MNAPKANVQAEVPVMSKDRIDLVALVALLVSLGSEAGEILREVQARPDLGSVDKGGELSLDGNYVADVQTAADREVEAHCVSVLLGTFPTVCVVAEESVCGIPVDEEGNAHAGTSPDCMKLEAKYVDPLSGPSAGEVMGACWPEHLRDVEASRVVVYIDPLDGTGEFVAGNLSAVTNLFGVAVDGVPVAGVINQPWAPGHLTGT